MTLDVGGGLESADDQRNQKTSTDDLDGADLTTGVSGEFPESDGSGGLTMTAALLAESAGVREEHGLETFNTGASTNDDFSDRASSRTGVTFGTAFGSAPEVLTGVNNIRGTDAERLNISTTGVDIQCVHYASFDPGGQEISWLAVGSE